MGKTVVSKGKTVKEAVNIALDLLSVQQNDVDIEIIKNGTKGIFGLGAKPAVVRVTVKERESRVKENPLDAPTLESLAEEALNAEINDGNTNDLAATDESAPPEDDVSGKVWVRDGYIFCKDAPDRYPMVTPGKGMKLYMNGVPVEQTVVISENDVLKVELQDEVQEPDWELKLSDDKMEAILKITPGIRIHKRLKDKSPDYYIQLEVEQKKIPIILQTRLIMDKLKELGVVHGINYAEIARACTSEEAGSFVIARGTPPVPGKHGYFMPVREFDIKKGLKERPDGTVDYREVQEIPSVEPGQVIGMIHPPVPGIPGRTVTDEPVFPPEVRPLAVKEGRGIVLVENGTKILATESGHPNIKIKGQSAIISVAPKLVIGKDVDLKTGNVHYVGDVEIVGNVQDGMLVEAQGHILIRQNVHTAKVLAGSSVIVLNNIIASEITAGKSTLLHAEISRILRRVIEQMKQMALAIHQLTSVSAFKVASFTRTGLGPLLKILYDGKFKSFHSLIAELINKIKSGTDVLEEDWVKFNEQLIRGFLTVHSSHLQSVDDLNRLIDTAEQLYNSIRDAEDDDECVIKARFAHNSRIYSGGDISLTGPGSYHSKLIAKGFIEVDGFVRGGEIYAVKGVKVGEAGTKGGISTKITVPKEGTIRIHKALEDTVIQVGTKMHKFTMETFHVHARLNDNGELMIS